MINKKQEKRFDDCLKYTMTAGKKALIQAGLEKAHCPEGYDTLNKLRCGVIIGSGMGGLTVFSDGKHRVDAFPPSCFK